MDDTLEAIYHLALARAAVERLAEKGISLLFNGRPSVLPSLERAYRELLYIRSHLPPENLDISEFSRFGRLVPHENSPHLD